MDRREGRSTYVVNNNVVVLLTVLTPHGTVIVAVAGAFVTVVVLPPYPLPPVWPV